MGYPGTDKPRKAGLRPPRSADLVIEGGTVITMEAGNPLIRDVRIYISEGRITDIRPIAEGPPLQECRGEIVDATNAIVMPGLVNGHTHVAMTLFRGFADDLPLKDWLYEKIFPAEAAFLSPETVYWGSLLGCLEMLSTGTTCMADGYFFQDETVRAVHDSGMRGIIAQGILDFPAPGVPDPKENLNVGKRFIEKWRSFSDRVTPGLFCHSPLTCSGKTLVDAFEISGTFGVPLQIHLSETEEEVDEIRKRYGKRPVHYLDRLGILSENLIAAHAVHLDDAEMARIGEKRVNIIHVPESNMKLGSGVSRIADMLKMTVKLGLGTDGCASNNDLDLFCEMDTAAKLGKIMAADSVFPDAETVLRMATSGGAAALGLEKEIGTIEKGKKADIIVLDPDSPHLCPNYDPISTVVYAANGADVTDVIVNGRLLIRNGKCLFLDPGEIMDRVKEICKQIAAFGRSGDATCGS